MALLIFFSKTGSYFFFSYVLRTPYVGFRYDCPPPGALRSSRGSLLFWGISLLSRPICLYPPFVILSSFSRLSPVRLHTALPFYFLFIPLRGLSFFASHRIRASSERRGLVGLLSGCRWGVAPSFAFPCLAPVDVSLPSLPSKRVFQLIFSSFFWCLVFPYRTA